MLSLENLAAILARDSQAAAREVREFEIGGREFPFNTQPSIMGVVNLSPDSWYRESVCLTVESAVRRGRVLAEQGAAIIDLGAESTLAHAARVGEAAQRDRLLPVIRGLREAGALVSIESYSPAVTRACLEAGARVLNLTGNEHGLEHYRLVAEYNAAVIICHVQGPHVRATGDCDQSRDPMELMTEYFDREITLAVKCGVEKILLDPGLGFYYRNLQDGTARVRRQMRVFLNTFRLRSLGWPLCHALPHAFEYFGEEVRSAEAFFCVLAALGKANLFRTHEVPRIRAVLETMKAF